MIYAEKSTSLFYQEADEELEEVPEGEMAEPEEGDEEWDEEIE